MDVIMDPVSMVVSIGVKEIYKKLYVRLFIFIDSFFQKKKKCISLL